MQLTFDIEDFRFDTPLPQLYQVRRVAQPPPPFDIEVEAAAQFDAIGLAAQLRPGMSIAVTAGSRGIHDIVPVLRAVVNYLKAADTRPFLVPAMGSHGGATAAGQVEMLSDLGITEATVGCPIRATMETVVVGQLADGTPAYMDRNAYEADGVIAVNRIKPHTDFHGVIESGLAKILVIGLGKRRGAENVHRFGPTGLRRLIPELAELIVGTSKVLAGLAILEDAHEQTAALAALPAAEIGGAGEHALLQRAYALMGRLPFDRLDVLVVNELGKNISGTGMDSNILGRMRIPGEPEPTSPQITVVVALDLTEASHGNASGLGLADLIGARLARKIDFRATYINSLTSGLGGVQRTMLPMALPTDRDAIAAALHCCAQPDEAQVRLARIRNTLALQELWITRALLEEATQAGYELVGEAAWEGLDS